MRQLTVSIVIVMLMFYLQGCSAILGSAKKKPTKVDYVNPAPCDLKTVSDQDLEKSKKISVATVIDGKDAEDMRKQFELLRATMNSLDQNPSIKGSIRLIMENGMYKGEYSLVPIVLQTGKQLSDLVKDAVDDQEEGFRNLNDELSKYYDDLIWLYEYVPDIRGLSEQEATLKYGEYIKRIYPNILGTYNKIRAVVTTMCLDYKLGLDVQGKKLLLNLWKTHQEMVTVLLTDDLKAMEKIANRETEAGLMQAVREHEQIREKRFRKLLRNIPIS